MKLFIITLKIVFLGRGKETKIKQNPCISSMTLKYTLSRLTNKAHLYLKESVNAGVNARLLTPVLATL